MTNRKIGFSSGFRFSPDSYSGFTIIEVALVLAIAGLIFLVVFLALPALQNSQADTARREDVGRVISALQSYEADNGGALPASGVYWPSNSTNAGATHSGFSKYIGNLSQITNYVYLAPSSSSFRADSTTSVANLFMGQLCPNDSRTPDSNDVAIVIRLSSGNTYCQDV